MHVCMCIRGLINTHARMHTRAATASASVICSYQQNLKKQSASRFYSLTVRTRDSDSRNPGSNPGRT